MSAVPPTVRAEGVTELAGDILLTCINNGSRPGVGVTKLTTNLSVSTNVFLGNTINFGAGTDITDAVLIVNENNCSTPVSVSGSYGACVGTDPRFQDPQFGRLGANNRVEWLDVEFPVPGASETGVLDEDCSDGGCFPFTTTLRVSSLRVYAAQLGLSGAQVTAFVSLSGPTAIPTNNNVLNIAAPILGLSRNAPSHAQITRCGSGATQVDLELSESFARAFRPLGQPSYLPETESGESGYFAPGSHGGGGAAHGTRFLLRFFNVPQGVSVSVPESVASAGQLTLALVNGTDGSGAGGALAAGTAMSPVSLNAGDGIAVYEVTAADPSVAESVSVPISVDFDSGAGADPELFETAGVSVTLAPITQVSGSSDTAPVPRFLDAGGDPYPLVTIAPCSTTLLFPHVTNQNGDDTSIAIANTSGINPDIPERAGACEIHYHGSTTGGGAAPAPQTSAIMQPGEQLTFTLSEGNPSRSIAGAPEFAGYVMALCEFDGAVGRVY